MQQSFSQTIEQQIKTDFAKGSNDDSRYRNRCGIPVAEEGPLDLAPLSSYPLDLVVDLVDVRSGTHDAP